MGKLRMSLLVCISIFVTFISTFCVHAAGTTPAPTAIEESAVTVKTSISASGVVIIVLLLMLIISVAINIWFVKTFFKHKEKFDNLHSKMCSLRCQNKSLKAKYSASQKNVNILDNWKEQAISLDSSIEVKVTELQSKHLAEDFDTKYGDLVNFSVSAKGYSLFKTACEAFENLPQTSKNCVQTNIEVLKQKYEAAKELQIQEATTTLKTALKSYGCTKKDLKKWDESIRYIQSLPKEIKDNIDTKLIVLVGRKQQEAYWKK